MQNKNLNVKFKLNQISLKFIKAKPRGKQSISSGHGTLSFCLNHLSQTIVKAFNNVVTSLIKDFISFGNNIFLIIFYPINTTYRNTRKSQAFSCGKNVSNSQKS